ncbi:MAG: DNA repair protein RadA, partial [Acidimicrobiales bacterium]
DRKGGRHRRVTPSVLTAGMPRLRSVHRCQSCGSASPRWAGRCPGCDEWNTMIEEHEVPARAGGAGGGLARGEAALRPAAIAQRIGSFDLDASIPQPTGVDELDRVLGGGLVPGSITLLGGEPGIGKSTLLLQVLARVARAGGRGLLVSAEESAAHVRRRAERLGAVAPELWVVAETSLAGVRAAIEAVGPDLVVVDSVQTVWDADLGSAPGSVTQVRGCAQQLAELARTSGIAIVLVGHVTKEGTLAGPRVLEHVVDTVLSFEGDRHHALRLLRAVKHRFGSTGELGLFEMTADGLVGVTDPAALFLGDRRPGAPGSVVFPAMEGRRPLLVEVQALVAPGGPTPARRSAAGIDGARLGMLLAVLDRRAGIRLGGAEVYVSVVGGVRIADPGADLAVCIAVASAALGRPVPPDLVVLGEVGLGGEVRQVAQGPQRLAEAARLGFTRAVGPAALSGPPGLPLSGVASLADAVGELLGAGQAPPRLVAQGHR